MASKAVWGLDPADVFESAYEADEERAARVPPEIKGNRSIMIRSVQDDYTTGVRINQHRVD